MSSINISAFHEMTLEDAQQAADDLAGDLSEKFAIDYGWDKDTIHFERPGVFGSIDVKGDEIRISAELGFLLAMLKPRIESEIRDYLHRHFGCTFER